MSVKESGIGIDEEVAIPKVAVGVEGSSLYLKENEKKTIEELLYGVMLRSGNDGATALAACMGGNLEHFIRMMNEKAERLGCTGTNFVNPSGLFDEKPLYDCARFSENCQMCDGKQNFSQSSRNKNVETVYK